MLGTERRRGVRGRVDCTHEGGIMCDVGAPRCGRIGRLILSHDSSGIVQSSHLRQRSLVVLSVRRHSPPVLGWSVYVSGTCSVEVIAMYVEGCNRAAAHLQNAAGRVSRRRAWSLRRSPRREHASLLECGNPFPVPFSDCSGSYPL